MHRLLHQSITARNVVVQRLPWSTGSVAMHRIIHSDAVHANVHGQPVPSIAKPIKTVLIANRGEIALRIMRTARRLGIRSVAVYSDADVNAPHVQMADDSIRLGPAAATDSYLHWQKIIEAAKQCGADALHPGYGFLSESYDFAQRCEDAQVTFIGPSSSAIKDMGVKSTSKRLMLEAGVPVVPGYHGDDQNDAKLLEESKRIGFPVMIKATHGGGGKGMRIANNEHEFADQLRSARTEAQQAFACSDVLIEKLVQRPRHVEVQVVGDHLGNCVYLFERDCSLQRRHQKVIEEAPAPGISAQVRRQLGEAAVRAAQAVGYVGAGTVEFIFDAQTQQFYFMEMNTRLQVEHPITEMITNTDLVEWQFRVAAGQALPVTQDQLSVTGHAFEARIYAEDPDHEFMPSAGLIHELHAPEADEHVRVELGARASDQVPIHYDPMIAKLIVWAPDRHSALNRLKRELSEFVVVGPKTNIDFLIRLCNEPAVQTAHMYTDLIKDRLEQLLDRHGSLTADQLAKLAVGHVVGGTADQSQQVRTNDGPFRTFGACTPRYELQLIDERNGRTHCVQVQPVGGGAFDVTIDSNIRLHNVCVRHVHVPGMRRLSIDFDGQRQSRFGLVQRADQLILYDGQRVACVRRQVPKHVQTPEEDAQFADRVVSPMPAVIQKVLFKQGDHVRKGQPMLVMIAMKMEHVIKANRDCVIKRIRPEVGQSVAKGEILVELDQ